VRQATSGIISTTMRPLLVSTTSTLFGSGVRQSEGPGAPGAAAGGAAAAGALAFGAAAAVTATAAKQAASRSVRFMDGTRNGPDAATPVCWI
jgi:hypothetical protein